MATYTERTGTFTYAHNYESVSLRYRIEDIVKVSTNYLIGEHDKEPGVAFILANDKLSSLAHEGVCYQMWATKFQALSWAAPETSTRYQMDWVEKKWHIGGDSEGPSPGLDRIPTLREVVSLFISAYLAAGYHLVEGTGGGGGGSTEVAYPERSGKG